ncbi:response regulator [Candidatus Daviesbacteria bacterium]|nr:response regulator [Candidatus Daviesbacteria bacterium]
MTQKAKNKILVLDDDPGILEAIKAILESEGYEVKAYERTDQIRISGEGRPDLIILDLLLSGKDGKEVARELKQNDKTKSIPIIMFSAHPTAWESAKESGVDDFLPKPFDMNELLSMVKKYI